MTGNAIKSLRWARHDNDQRLDHRLSSTRLCLTYLCPGQALSHYATVYLAISSLTAGTRSVGTSMRV